jgi:single-strand DNA-binding protein
MPNLNKVMLMGNLTRDPEIKYTPSGTAVADISLAINRTFKVNEEKREETTFVDITLWGRIAEIVGEYCKKGNPLYVEGRLQLEQWDDKESGQKRSKLKVVGETIQLLGGKPQGNSSSHEEKPNGAEKPQYTRRKPAPKPPADTDAAQDDIPF